MGFYGWNIASISQAHTAWEGCVTEYSFTLGEMLRARMQNSLWILMLHCIITTSFCFPAQGCQFYQSYFSTAPFSICIFLWNCFAETNELKAARGKNMIKKKKAKNNNKTNKNKHLLLKRIRAVCFGWMQNFSVKIKEMVLSVPHLSLFHSPLPPPPSLCVSLFYMQPIIGAPDGSLMCSQRAPLHAHVSAVEWVTRTDSRWCSLGTRGLIHPLSPLSMQSIIILLLCLLPQDHWGDSGPPSSVPSFTFVQGNVSLPSLGLFIQGAGGS